VNRLRGTQLAKGIKGILIRVGDRHVFRVYAEDHTFIDYDILHHDLEIQILDDAMLYRTDFGSYLDYPPLDESK
jgi:hypothetical protein